MALQHLRSNTASKRPTPGSMSDGQLAINTNATSPGLFFKDAGGALIKVGPVHVGTSAPNSVPAGSSGNAVGEQWLDTSGGGYVLKIWDGTAWRSETGQFVDVAGDTMTGNLTISGADLIMSNGEIVAETGSAATPSITFTGDTNTGLYSPGADQVALSTNGTGRVFIGDSGNVGIGASSPSTKLEVAGSDDSNNFIVGVNNTNFAVYHDDTIGEIRLKAEDGSGNNFAKFLTFYTHPSGLASTERLRITSTGQLSHIGGGSAVSPAVGFNGSAPSNSLVIDSTGRVGIGTSAPGAILEIQRNAATALRITRQNAVSNYCKIEAAGSNSEQLTIETDPTNAGAGYIDFKNGGASKMRLTSTGLGIGTTSPAQALHLNEDDSECGIVITSSNSGAAVIQLGDQADTNAGQITYLNSEDALLFRTAGSGEDCRIDSSGRLLVGTSSWITDHGVVVAKSGSNVSGSLFVGKYDNVMSSGDFAGQVAFGSSFDGNIGALIKSEADAAWTHGSSHPGRLVFSTTADGASSPTERMRIDSNGNVGIGTSSPAQKLDVQGAGSQFIRIRTNDTSGSAVGVLRAEYAGGGGGTNTNVELRAGDSYSYLVSTTNAPLLFGINGSERMRIDSSGRLLVGTSSAPSTSPASLALLTVSNNTTSQNIGYLNLQNTATILNNYGLGQIVFSGNGNNGYPGAYIAGTADATWSSNSYPTRLVFSTTADGASSPTERMRITNAGFAKHSDTGAYVDSNDTFHEFRNTTNSHCLYNTSTNASLDKSVYVGLASRAANSAYQFFLAFSGGGADIEFNLRGDGNGLCDGAWTGGGADYAEYFEWSDGNSAAEDRRGISVVLDGDKIREAVVGEDPIGVISGNPSVVGDSAWNKWDGKYLRDEFGTYIQEDYEVTDEDGNTVIQQRRKLNPAYDPDVEYISREQRPEWDCVGLMGKLRIRKGQVTGSRWIKMRDISDSVEEWLVR